MLFLELTDADDGTRVDVHMDKVLYMVEGEHGTLLVFEANSILVSERIEDIKKFIISHDSLNASRRV